MKQDLLIEIGCEEIPARFVRSSHEQLGELTSQWLKEQRIAFDDYQTFATPRRLAVLVKAVAAKQEDQVEEVRGPAVRIAQKAGEWTPAAHGFARKLGITVNQLNIQKYKGEEYIFAQRSEVGANTTEQLQNQLFQVFQALHFPSTMHWGDHYRFVRPVRWLVTLWGNEVVPVKWAGVQADRISRGHRFLGTDVVLPSAANYVETLRDQFVIVDEKERQKQIVQQIHSLEQQHDFKVVINEDLLAEVTNLVEYPTALVGNYAQNFLTIPKKVLTTTMQEHQRYFPVENQNRELLPHFVTIRNGDQRSLHVVQKGNEKVLHARLADARFFYDEDLKQPIAHAVEKLDRIVFHEELGTVGERIQRVTTITEHLSELIDMNHETKVLLLRAAAICKFDLGTQMVNEFSKLEGYMGYEYAVSQQEDERVARAIYEHHFPRSISDQVPRDLISAILSLADKVEMIVAIFGIGTQPTGSQDPYSLRRKALGILRILLQTEAIAIPLNQLWSITLDTLEEKQLLQQPRTKIEYEISQFFHTRFKTIFQGQNIRYDVIDSLVDSDTDLLPLRMRKGMYIMEQLQRNEFKWEVEAYTRAANIVHAQDQGAILSPDLFQQDEEQEFYGVILKAQDDFAEEEMIQDVSCMYTAIQQLAPAIHHFFDHVMVMVKDSKVRDNRLALLREVVEITQRFTAFEKIIFPTE